MNDAAPFAALERFLAGHPRLYVLTGAGISTGSGIPAYRDEHGAWTRPAPVQYHDFVTHEATRRRYWARSLLGWPRFRNARPNACHDALATWEGTGRVRQLVTQNVDRLHQAAGSRAVIDLHGRLDRVVCLDCSAAFARDTVQDELRAHNPAFVGLLADMGPDGDALLEDAEFSRFVVPACPCCGGMLKPDVVFFGESVPADVTRAAMDALADADALLVIGSSLMVYSGFRFCRAAATRGQPIAAITPGETRADDLLDLKVKARFEDVIDAL